MGDSKRRKDLMGDQYGQESNILPWLPVKKSQASTFVKLSTQGAWIGIGGLVVYWVAVRFLGPALGFWQLSQ
ncbi:MAG: DUF2839 domain-containing protein [Elainellaceae cyanobacterium]